MNEHRYTITFLATPNGADQVHDFISSLRMVSGVSPACVVLPREDQEPMIHSLCWLLNSHRMHMKRLVRQLVELPRHHLVCRDGGMYDDLDPRGDHVEWADLLQILGDDPVEKVLARTPLRDEDGSPFYSDQWWVEALENAGNHAQLRTDHATLLRACAAAVKLARLVLTPTPQPRER